ncbi:MAG: aldolase [Proteobacteria bacterium]|nr:aldolase [Pseudomonadota bacterium]
MFPLKTILISNDPGVAEDAQAAGIARIMVDLETSEEKKVRQSTRKTFISTHTRADIPKMRKVVKEAELVVRINGWNSNSFEEIDFVVGAGADRIMLPMITSLAQWESFLERLDGRAKPFPLVETGYSMAHISSIAAEKTVDDIFIGLNDLHLSLGLDFLFEPLGLGLIDWMASQIFAAGKHFGFGGMATLHSGELPAERILAEHVRLNSTGVILSSRFNKDVRMNEPEGRRERISDAMKQLQVEYHRLAKRNALQQHEDSKQTFALIRQLAERARTRSSF